HVNKDSAQHDNGGDVVQNIAERHRNWSEGSCSRPENDPGDEIDDAPNHDLPELHLLASVEEACIWRVKLFLTRNGATQAAHPGAVCLSPRHWLQPVQSLEREEEH